MGNKKRGINGRKSLKWERNRKGKEEGDEKWKIRVGVVGEGASWRGS